MKSKDIFGLTLRMIGLIFLYQALAAVPAANFCPIFPHFNLRSLIPSLFLVGWPLVVAWWLVEGAPRLMRRAFPEKPNDSDVSK